MNEEEIIAMAKDLDRVIKEAVNNLIDSLAKMFGSIDSKELRKYQRRVEYHKRLSQRNNERNRKRHK